MKADLIVQNARIVAQTGVFVGWLAVQDGRIAALGEGPAPGPAKTVLDGTGQVLLPGAIDTHPHFFDPGAEWREDLRCGTQAAASGGYTTILDMPNTSPPVKDEATWQLKAGRAQQNSLIDFALWGSAMPSNLDELGRLASCTARDHSPPACAPEKPFTRAGFSACAPKIPPSAATACISRSWPYSSDQSKSGPASRVNAL